MKCSVRLWIGEYCDQFFTRDYNVLSDLLNGDIADKQSCWHDINLAVVFEKLKSVVDKI